MFDESWFERLGELPVDVTERAPARLKSKIYSAVVRRMAESGPLAGLLDAKQAGERLCVFETILTMLPPSLDAGSRNPCRICHARMLAERLEHAPIFWPGCPYSGFHNG